MKHYTDIIIAPVITEKSMANRQNNVYTLFCLLAIDFSVMTGAIMISV